MTHTFALRALRLTALGLATAMGAAAQSPGIEWSGLAYIDYEYLLADDDPDAVGENTFTFRRIYLTADASPAPAFDVRARVEANDRSTTVEGRPAPFVKDAWVRWTYASSGHRATLGLQPPPQFGVSESTWGYRSLDATVLDRTKIRSSRDFGLRLDGPVAGAVRYSAMVGNASSAAADRDRGKAVYGQLAAVSGALRASLGADYRETVLPGVPTEASLRSSAFVGAVTEAVRGGVELFHLRSTSEAPGDAAVDGGGVSVFGAVDLSARTSVIARYDYVDDDLDGIGADAHYVLAAFAYRPAPFLSLMPNVIVTRPAGADASVLGRVTASARF